MGHGSSLENLLLDLDHVLHILDGRESPGRDAGLATLVRKEMDTLRSHVVPGELSTRYVRLKWFKVGTLHVWLLRDELRERMNQVLASTNPDSLTDHACA